MTFVSNKTRALEGAPVLQRWNDLRLTAAERIANYRLYRSTLAQLAMLSDRELSDLGMSRGMIHEAATKATYTA